MIFETPTLSPASFGVLERIDDLRGRLGVYTREPSRWSGVLRRNIFAHAIRGSNSIEGYVVTVDDAIAAVVEEAPLDADAATWAEITGYRQAMTWVLQLARDPQFRHSTDQIKSLHYMLLQHDLAKGPGHWRPGHVAVVDESTKTPVYEGPDAALVPALMDELIDALNARGQAHVVVRAAMAHLNLTMIHPFRDGNGRLARCLQSLVLGREGILAPEFSSIEEYLGRNTGDYYAALSAAGGKTWSPGNDASRWIEFCLLAHFRQATTLLRRVERLRRLWDILEREIATRGLPERAILALSDAAEGHRVRNPIYRRAADITPNLASRDLRLLVDQGLLEARGEKKGRFYVASTRLRAIAREDRPLDEPIENPFEVA
jgi:Fic family protein